jgi:Oxidoreductase DRL, catalytic domain
MNSELQIVSGTALAHRDTLVEAEGDQPGCLAALAREARDLGFDTRVYGNVKRFLNLAPTPSEMRYWAARQGISLEQVTAFTDGTKVQIEQALVANGLGAAITCRNLTGLACETVEEGATRLAALADAMDTPISDYLLSPRAPAGVFVVGRHREEQRPYLDYLKLGSGPDYLLLRPFHLVHLEIPKTIRHVLADRNEWRFNNGPRSRCWPWPSATSPRVSRCPAAWAALPSAERRRRSRRILPPCLSGYCKERLSCGRWPRETSSPSMPWSSRVRVPLSCGKRRCASSWIHTRTVHLEQRSIL